MRSHADFTGKFFLKGIPKVQIDPQFVHTFTILGERFSDRILEIIDRGTDAHSFLGMYFT
jgi:hypothetical protein